MMHTYAGTATYRFAPDKTNGYDARFSNVNGTVDDVSLLVGWPYVSLMKWELQFSAIRFDLSKVPIPNSSVTKIVLWMYCYAPGSTVAGQNIRIYEPYTWNNYSPLPQSVKRFVGRITAPTTTGLYGFLLPNTWYQTWKDPYNTGFLFTPDKQNMPTAFFYSSNKSDYNKRPYLRIEFTMPSLARPFPGFLSTKPITQKFGELWQNSYSKNSYRLLHNAVDVSTSAGTAVTACMNGTVKYITNYDNVNAQIVCVASDAGGTPIMITYTHVVTNLRVGDSVVKGKTIIGWIAAIPEGAHLHLQCRIGNTGDSRLFTVGRLPETSDYTWYPNSGTYLIDDGFPGFYLNPQELPWE